ncbi:MAG TPA: aminomethyl-transferring glycine dehydrogenase [Polyangia bacterium]|nr:aminomethyl-transferring glycine dehydrogenase [Polyangia bacterium]
MAVDLESKDRFPSRHIGPDDADVAEMLAALGVASLDALVAQTVPADIRLAGDLNLPAAVTEAEVLAELRALSEKNQIWKSYLGQGYSDCVTPPVVLRNILENPGWYTQYTPYQAEISQGRLEALLNYQTLVTDLTGLPVANASLLDEGTAAAEAMHMLSGVAPAAQGDEGARAAFVVSAGCHPQTIEVVRTRAKPLGVEVVVVTDVFAFDFTSQPVFGVLAQYPATDGALGTAAAWRGLCDKAHAAGALVVLATDLLALTVLTPPGELGADVAVGSAQRFGVPLGYGGPHAAFFATKDEWVRKLPGRLIGVSQDAHGHMALRMALQTREQHIRREKATSNICTAQVLLAVVASMYAVWHGPKGLRAIAERVGGLAAVLARGLARLGVAVAHAQFFDTVRVRGSAAEVDAWLAAAAQHRINLRRLDAGSLTIALDETTTADDVRALFEVFAGDQSVAFTPAELAADAQLPWQGKRASDLGRTTPYLSHPVFNAHHSETEMLRYMRRLEARDLSLTHAMIPLGSCTMKLNATAEMLPITWPAWNRLHPFAPTAQTGGYQALFKQLESMLSEITGFAATSLQPNAGSQGEYAGLLVVRAYHESRGQGHRDVCLIPSSAHGTNPASAVMAGYRVVVVACDDGGNVDLADLEAKANEHREQLAALMVTYPSTHGVFEPGIKRVTAIVHEHGGQVYMDGANMNAQVGLTRPADIGADVCHINLHKTFCIPHGGGGPGMGPISVAKHLAPFLPSHPLVETNGGKTGTGTGIGPVSAAPWGSASILLISWTYIRMMGAAGLKRATEVAILSANYVARRLQDHFPVVYKGAGGRVAHECIVDTRHLKKLAGVEVDDIAKRLMDYGFHAPTMSFPIPGTLMIEPTESEPKAELDRFCDAMIAIRGEIAEIERGTTPREGNVLKNAPHTAAALLATEWPHPYSREQAAYPLAYVRAAKFWPPVGRLNNVLGDRKLHCTCPDISEYA